jgi:tRNA threonylcarbamoyladenosine biosynthesis protein TsaB
MNAGGILGIDTSTADATVAVTCAGRPVADRRLGPGDDGRPRHAAALLGEIEEAVAEAGGWERIDLLAVGIGPGMFTGLRIGVATARALAQGRALPICPVSSLAALARGVIERHPGRAVAPLTDARRGEVFAALFDPDGAALLEPWTESPEAVEGRLLAAAEKPLAAGDGSLRFRAQLESAGVEVLPDADPAHRMAARHVCALAARLEPGLPTDVTPAYLRRPDAEVWREQRKLDHGSAAG